MVSQETNTIIVDAYIGILDNLNTSSKLDIISKLTASVKADLNGKRSQFKKAFGAYESDESAEELISEIRSSRVFNRKIEPL